mmetsp:Transcript_11130/g.26833  ORF Transcript_11130/g.26833 Transcript_11130/m.26833 type:complete len:189 (-) Transcript_11130:1295-1861(-)
MMMCTINGREMKKMGGSAAGSKGIEMLLFGVLCFSDSFIHNVIMIDNITQCSYACRTRGLFFVHYYYITTSVFLLDAVREGTSWERNLLAWIDFLLPWPVVALVFVYRILPKSILERIRTSILGHSTMAADRTWEDDLEAPWANELPAWNIQMSRFLLQDHSRRLYLHQHPGGDAVQICLVGHFVLLS